MPSANFRAGRGVVVESEDCNQDKRSKSHTYIVLTDGSKLEMGIWNWKTGNWKLSKNLEFE